MNTLESRIENIGSTDPLDQMIFERGLRIRRVWFDKAIDLIVVLLNNKKILKRSISDFERLRSATEADLNNFETDGIGIHWPNLDEDLSLRGFLRYELEQMELPALVSK